jgi:hypothetical protein
LEATTVSDLTFKVVPDEYLACPRCGAYWGHPDKALDFPNRYKVDDWAKCFNPNCQVGYYQPSTGQVEMKPKETPEQQKERFLALQKQVQEDIRKNGLKVTTHHADGTVTDDSIPPKV